MQAWHGIGVQNSFNGLRLGLERGIGIQVSVRSNVQDLCITKHTVCVSIAMIPPLGDLNVFIFTE